jgi:trypsin
VARVRGRFLLGVALALGALLAAAASASAAAQPRIVGGGDVTIESAPYQVLVTVSGDQCGGVIRDATHVITAGHCATQDLGVTRVATPASFFSIGYGSANTTQQQHVNVSAVGVPSQYLAGDSSYDAALLTLSAPLAGYGGPTVNGITFAGSPAVNAAITGGGSGYATGWGLRNENDTSAQLPQQLQGVSIPFRTDATCVTQFQTAYSPDRMVCAGGGSTPGDNNPDTCSGDSGGPLALNVGGTLKLAGITSFGQGCGEQGIPAAYTDVSSYQICAFLGGGAACDAAPVLTPRVVPDTTRPAARVSKVSCKRRRCTFHVRTSDNSGHVASVRMRLYRNVRSCKTVHGKRRCRTVKHSRKLHATRISGGFRASAKLAVARYRLDAVAADAAHNASKTARKRFRVKKS